MPNLMENRLLWQYLSAAGQDIGAGKPIGANVNEVTQQNIAAQSYVKLLSQLLSGGGKINLDRDNISIKAPVAAFQGPSGPGSASPLAAPQENIGLRGPDGTAGVSTDVTGLKPVAGATPEVSSSQSVLSTLLQGNLGVVNPSGSPLGDLTGADLAGLTTQDISQALQFKFAQTKMGRESVNDLINNIYKLSVMDEATQRTKIGQARELRLWKDMMQTAPLEIPGLGRLSLNEWEKLDTKTKAYSYYAFDASRRGEAILSFNEFTQQADPGSLAGYYELAKKDPEFRKFYFESKVAGATKISIGQKALSRKALNWVDAVDDMQADVEKHMASDAVQDKLIQYDMGSEKEALAKAESRVKFIEQRIRTAGGKIIDVSYDPKTKIMVWTVENPLGETEEISYGIRD